MWLLNVVCVCGFCVHLKKSTSPISPPPPPLPGHNVDQHKNIFVHLGGPPEHMFNIVSGKGGWNGEVDFRKGGFTEKCHFQRGAAHHGLGTISGPSPQSAFTCKVATRTGAQISMPSRAFGVWCRKRLRKAGLRACCLGRNLLPSFAAPVPRSTANAAPSPRPCAPTRTSEPRRSWTSRVRGASGEGAAS